jgi:deoxyhypusine synthase
MNPEPVSEFMKRHFRHFNAATLLDAAEGYRQLIERGGRMLLAVAGAMSTAELGVSLAEMIRRDKVHAISCTGANLEEDLFNLIARDHYLRVPHYRHLSAMDEKKLFLRRLNRVTDTCIPEDRAVEPAYAAFRDKLRSLVAGGTRPFPHEVVYGLLRDGTLRERYCIDPSDSWVLAASEKDLPMFVPGWADSTLGNMFTADCIRGSFADPCCIRSGVEYLAGLASWYKMASRRGPSGFFQIGGGIAGDFAVCVVPMLNRDLEEEVPAWSYYCQISDSVTSYGSYSGAVPNEKITWGKLDSETARFVIESDATIVAPLLFAYVLGQ